MLRISGGLPIEASQTVIRKTPAVHGYLGQPQ
jgi:hypothetical protein